MTTRFEITKGTEEDFEGAPDWALQVYHQKINIGRELRYAVTELDYLSAAFIIETGISTEISNPNAFTLIAERHPLTGRWINWKGGVCPVAQDTKVDTMWSDGKNRTGIFNNNVSWRHDTGCSNIIAYRLSQPESSVTWDGRGLPPVGIKCEVDIEGWVECEVIAHFNQRCGMVAAFIVDGFHGSKRLDSYNASCFRPIRSPEQVEREKAIDAITEVLRSLSDCYQEYDAAEALYDAGYRKLPEGN